MRSVALCLEAFDEKPSGFSGFMPSSDAVQDNSDRAYVPLMIHDNSAGRTRPRYSSKRLFMNHIRLHPLLPSWLVCDHDIPI